METHRKSSCRSPLKVILCSARREHWAGPAIDSHAAHVGFLLDPYLMGDEPHPFQAWELDAQPVVRQLLPRFGMDIVTFAAVSGHHALLNSVRCSASRIS